MEPLTPRYTAELFPPLHRELMSLLRGLPTADWDRPTVAGSWLVRDVAAHLLDGDLRKLSAYRDGHMPRPPAPIHDHRGLVAFLNALNAEWVAAARRLSPRVLVELLEVTGLQLSTLVAALPPHAASLFPVAWAGEGDSENWMDTGREYTERWHHQMQIRDAVGAPGLLDGRWLTPLLDLSVRALPRAYSATLAPAGTSMVFVVAGAHDERVGSWTLSRERDGWRLWRGAAERPTTVVHADGDAAWRLLYNALPEAAARERLRVEGEAWLAEPLFTARSVMV
jgi:hypothetical protein